MSRVADMTISLSGRMAFLPLRCFWARFSRASIMSVCSERSWASSTTMTE